MTDGGKPEFLQTGLDTVECAYYLDVLSATGFDFEALVAQREELRYSPEREPRAIKLGGMEFFLWPYGTASGYSIILTNRHYRIECSAGMNPSFFVKFTSEGLWTVGLRELHRQFMEWARRIRGIRCNASRKRHAELDEFETLDDGDPVELGGQYMAIKAKLPWLNVFGGCCGSDLRHVTQIARALAA